MNLKKTRKVQDLGSHFLVDHETHGAFKVAKKGLSQNVLGKIQAMATGGTVEKGFNDGGVKRFADGGDVDFTQPQGGTDWSSPPPLSVPDVNAAYAQEMGAKAGANALPSGNLPSDTPAPVGSGVLAGPNDAYLAGMGQKAAENALPSGNLPSDTPAPGATAAALGPVTPTPNETQPISNAMPPPAQPIGAQAPTTPKPPAMPSAGGIFKDIDAQAAAVRQGANVAAQEEAEKAKAWKEFQAQTGARQKAFEASMAAQDSEYQQIKSDVAAQKLNPNRLWQSMSVGNKVLAAISMVVGGLAQSATGGHNQALGVIQDAISRDIDAQKSELGKKTTLLEANLKKTGDMRLAEQQTRAMMLGAVEGQLSGIAAKYGGDKAKAQADLMGAQLAQQRDQLKYQIALQHSQLAGTQAQQAQYADAYARMLQGKGTPLDEVIMGKDSERIVDTPQGRAIAHSKDAADKYREASAEIGQVRDVVSQLQAAAHELKTGTLDPKKKAALTVKAQMLALQLPSAIAGLKRLNEAEYSAASSATPDPGDVLQLHDRALGKLDALGQLLDTRLRVAGNTYLVKPSQRAVQTIK